MNSRIAFELARLNSCLVIYVIIQRPDKGTFGGAGAAATPLAGGGGLTWNVKCIVRSRATPLSSAYGLAIDQCLDV